MKVPFHSILCPTDLSEIGNLAVPLAYRLASDRATVHLLHVGEPPFLGNPLYSQYVDAGYVPTPEERAQGEENVRGRLRDLPPKDALTRGIRSEIHYVPGIDVADAIEECARELEVDAIVMGTRGRTGLSRIVMGSVAERVVKKERLPVILVHEDLG